MYIYIRTCTFRKRERSSQRDILCYVNLNCFVIGYHDRQKIKSIYHYNLFAPTRDNFISGLGSFIILQTPPVTWWWKNAVWSNTLSPTMYSLVSSSIQLLFQSLKFSIEGSGIFARFISEYEQVWSYRECSGADARSRKALVTFKEVSHTAFPPSSR